jgi:predicted AAA+ superfamily ATPase
VREFGRRHFGSVLEINFDRTPEKARYFEGGDLAKSLSLLEVDAAQRIVPGETLLFLDEIQAVPELLSVLRYFYEEFPDLHVVAAGSLMEFALSSKAFSMPVGRVESIYLGPMDFEEFLQAQGHDMRVDFLRRLTLPAGIPQPLHDALLDDLRLFFLVGGMPAALRCHVETGSLLEVQREQEILLQTLEDDFAKYGRPAEPSLISAVFRRIPAEVGRRVKYSRLDSERRSREVAAALRHLEMAQIAYRVLHSAGNGLPLAAQAKDRGFKVLFLDVGLLSRALGLEASVRTDDMLSTYRGAVAEQFVGQHRMQAGGAGCASELYYWNRQKKSSTAEVDYLLVHHGRIVPVEVKAGRSGSLKSLHIFLQEKQADLAVRFNASPPLLQSLRTPSPQNHPYQLLSLPLYLVGQVERLLGEMA